MFKICDNKIFISRGNTASLELFIADHNGTPYLLKKNDKLVFSVKKACDHSEVLIRKDTYTIATFKDDNKPSYNIYTFNIESADTESLDFGNYVYDVVLYFANGRTETIIDPSQFRICRAVGT